MSPLIEPSKQHRILGDSWYASEIEGLCDTLDARIANSKYPEWLKRIDLFLNKIS